MPNRPAPEVRAVAEPLREADGTGTRPCSPCSWTPACATPREPPLQWSDLDLDRSLEQHPGRPGPTPAPSGGDSSRGALRLPSGAGHGLVGPRSGPSDLRATVSGRLAG